MHKSQIYIRKISNFYRQRNIHLHNDFKWNSADTQSKSMHLLENRVRTCSDNTPAHKFGIKFKRLFRNKSPSVAIACVFACVFRIIWDVFVYCDRTVSQQSIYKYMTILSSVEIWNFPNSNLRFVQYGILMYYFSLLVKP